METPKTKAQIFKEYAISSGVTFLAAMALALLVALDSVDTTTMEPGTYLVIFIALRAGIKAASEYLIAKATANLVK